ncbi:MAG: peptide ABC transporter permease [Oceanicaulis sp.]|jgi:oligopeptide transport system permease protein|uniref:ABC transporter permease subunit n=1 Tax=unclassified Oceanicaulis TaxID=2632123 RepID=UPI000066BBBF|nr:MULTISPECIES: ABC transporter permease subunit [unclassified Oceanicaulis]EAP89109.1 oligopeptide transport system permease protein OppC [Oceanicaulis alexandrii HTCC2633] [Oceanicaulis sp. HTCC2633]MBC39408.1 peptide ABC transporter permease [Oceanicaulis sp.]MBG35107.1 peptide ABC transporter permease [Oceanicaulis sp.]HBU63722.1 peptide ABC transporter permease [Oceanicaulis sp.]|tara:strand:+ start:1850 stop:2755 length:906 start_codon:yes stop_codon:yes gene_type:complete
MVLTSTPQEKAELMEQSAVKGRSLWDDARTRLLRNKAAVASLILLGVLVLLALVGPLIWVHDSTFIYRDKVQIAPTLTDLHIFGTDAQGRDLFARVLVGLRMSLMVGVVATFVSLLIGVTWGAIAGFVGGKLDQLMMRVVDILYSLPFIFFVIILMVVFGRNIILIFVAIGAVEWLTMARIVRGQTIALKSMEFVEAAHAAGVSQGAIIRRHIVPNVLGPVVVYVTLTIPVVILAESFLSFLGLGVQEPLTSLGNLISNGARDMEIAPWTLIFPALTMMLTLFCFNFIGDGLRDAIDPKDR